MFTDKSQQIHSSQTPQNSTAGVQERAFCCHVCAWGGITSDTPKSHICFFRSDLWRPHEELVYFYKANIIINRTFALAFLCLTVCNVAKSVFNTKTGGGNYSIFFYWQWPADNRSIQVWSTKCISGNKEFWAGQQQMLSGSVCRMWSSDWRLGISIWPVSEESASSWWAGHSTACDENTVLILKWEAAKTETFTHQKWLGKCWVTKVHIVKEILLKKS